MCVAREALYNYPQLAFRVRCLTQSLAYLFSKSFCLVLINEHIPFEDFVLLRQLFRHVVGALACEEYIVFYHPGRIAGEDRIRRDYLVCRDRAGSEDAPRSHDAALEYHGVLADPAVIAYDYALAHIDAFMCRRVINDMHIGCPDTDSGREQAFPADYDVLPLGNIYVNGSVIGVLAKIYGCPAPHGETELILVFDVRRNVCDRVVACEVYFAFFEFGRVLNIKDIAGALERYDRFAEIGIAYYGIVLWGGYFYAKFFDHLVPDSFLTFVL